jgi:hypothetical protein
MTTRALGILASLIAACGTAANDIDTSGPRTRVPADLAGSWYHGSVSPSNFHDTQTGSWDSAYGEGLFYTFYEDGRFEYGWRAYTSSYGCNDVAMVYKSGTVTVDAAARTVVTHPTKAVLHSTDNCNPAWNYDKDIPRDSETLFWERGVDDYGGEALLLSSPTATASAFYPWNP